MADAQEVDAVSACIRVILAPPVTSGKCEVPYAAWHSRASHRRG